MSNRMLMVVIMNCVIGSFIGGICGKEAALLWGFGLFCGALYWIVDSPSRKF